MAGLGQVNVTLGLDAAEYTRGLTRAEYQARKFGQEIGEQMRSGASIAAGAFTALAASATLAIDKIRAQVDSLDAFNDLRDITGASIENISALDRVARQTGGTFGTVEASLVKFNAALKEAKPGDDASRVLTALNLNVTELKNLDPAEALRRTAVAFGHFESDGSKARAMQELFGKSVKEVAPFLNDLAEKNTLVGSTSTAAAAQAEVFNKQLFELKANAQDAARSITTSLLPAMNTFLKNFKEIRAQGNLGLIVKDAAKDVFGFGQLSSDAGTDIKNLIRTRDRLQKDLAFSTSKGFATRGIEDSLKDVGRLLDVSRARQRNTVESMFIGEDFGDAVSRKFDKRNYLNVADKPEKGTKAHDTSAQEAKAQLAADLDAIKNAQDAITNTYANQDKILSAMRAAGLQDEGQYYAEKLRLLNLSAAAQEDGLQKSIERLKQEQLTGKDAIDNQKKIAEETAKLAKVQEDSATQARIYGIEQESAYKRIASSLLSARQAAADLFDTTNRGYTRALEGIGQGTKARDLSAGITQIEDRYREQRQALQNQKAQAELMGSFGPDAQKQFDEQLAIINEFQSKAITSYRDYYGKLDTLSKDWATGASEALKNYADEAANTAKLAETAFGNAFKGLEDVLVDFVTTGKGDFKSLVDSIIKDIARIGIKQQITGPLAEWLGGSVKGSGGGEGGSWLSGLLSLFGGGKAIGGPVEAGKFYQVNERGPEMLDVNGKSFLMMGNQRGNITPNSKLGGGGMVLNLVQNFPAGTTRQTADQAAQSAGRAVERAQRRNG
jgi:lambda family phage tail tape measure protein